MAAVMAERLRRLTRNQMGFPRAGSNPAHSVMGFEPQTMLSKGDDGSACCSTGLCVVVVCYKQWLPVPRDIGMWNVLPSGIC